MNDFIKAFAVSHRNKPKPSEGTDISLWKAAGSTLFQQYRENLLRVAVLLTVYEMKKYCHSLSSLK